jgi:SulP family sulfate permease
MLTGWSLVDQKAIAEIWEAGNSDRNIMVVTILATLLVPLRFAVLVGISTSIVYYLLETSKPRVRALKMNSDFRYFTPRPDQPSCPQLGVVEILGDLYFGAAGHIEDSIEEHLRRHPRQRFLLLRMYAVENCDISGIHALESIIQTCRDRGGDVYLVHVQKPVLQLMKTSGFREYLGEDHFLDPDRDVSYLFHKVIDPSVCIYECSVRAFEPCQNLPKRLHDAEIAWGKQVSGEEVPLINPQDLWAALRSNQPPVVVDVREPGEYERAHIPQARLIPLPELLGSKEIPRNRPVVLVCREGRRSLRGAAMLRRENYANVKALDGGMQEWERYNLLEAVQYARQE